MILNSYDTDKIFDYENGYYATATEARFGKFIAQGKSMLPCNILIKI